MTAITAQGQGKDVKLVLVVLVLILIFLQLRLWKGAGSLEDIQRLEREIATQQADNTVLLERNEVLRDEVSDLKTGQDSIEERARSELGLIKKGETFYLIIDESNPHPVAAEIKEPATLNTSP